MYISERDEYADAHRRSGPRLSLWLLWLLATGASFYFAHVIVQGMDQAEQFGGPAYWGFLIARGAVQGLFVGAAQGLILLVYLRKSAWPQWVLATIIGWAARSLLLFMLSDWLENSFLDFRAPGLLAATSLGGIILGIAVGLPQSYVLRAYVDHPGWWVFLNAGSAVIGRAAAAAVVLGGTMDDAIIVATVDATVTAAITGAILVDMLRSSRTRLEKPQDKPVPKPPELSIHALGEQAEVAPGLFLTFGEVEISPSSIVWRAIIRNTTENDLNFSMDQAALQVSDSTQKPYAISNVSTGSEHVPAHDSVQVEVTASVLSYSPIPPGAAYLDLQFIPGNESAFVFRRYL